MQRHFTLVSASADPLAAFSHAAALLGCVVIEVTATSRRVAFEADRSCFGGIGRDSTARSIVFRFRLLIVKSFMEVR